MQVLVYGAGQLAQMMYLEGCPMGIEVLAVDVKNEQVVHPVTKQTVDITLEQAIENAVALTVEFEHVPEHLLEQASRSGKLLPSIDTVLAGADRVREKRLLTKLGVANCPHQVVTNIHQLDDCVEDLGERLILKASRDGYDGYGQWRLTAHSGLAALKSTLQGLDLATVPLVVEQMVDFDREISIIGVRDKLGNTRVYPLAENLHHKGQLHVSVAPALNITDSQQKQAESIFATLAEGMDYVGVLAIELFQCGEQLLVNEIAPRVHNSGHWTLSGSDVSQFNNHLRAVTGLPLGQSNALNVNAMVNVIGCSSFSSDLLSIPGCHLYWYGKTAREKRKMGHINLTAENYTELGDKLLSLSEYVPLEHFPKLVEEAKRLKSLSVA
ncbi:5-(carboxyamino)imidazole ribonucleotide synthase [Alteromonas sp. ASW11-130]|uniref:5-(carboxyamino)imidazole ribonucleotide synthase n=1 Tax=Alteromonas sp. ASW11-130 TaxID=3015775 RepID=UPI0022420653|nr:5-(carboxyamino)imidazole ribonucleotide synthase [Alteromonas sp. ASW11-130]MCW8090859.1 5-(carboxyamino)imidazole ribonucleotide synthase [Alteromonas sp. ASW11-130]